MSAEERGAHDTLMWEVRAVEGKREELIDWIERTAVPSLRDQPQFRCADVYTSADDRAVIIARFHGPPPRAPEAPDELVSRPAHQWPFQHRPRASANA